MLTVYVLSVTGFTLQQQGPGSAVETSGPFRKSLPTSGVFHQTFLRKNTELREYVNYKGIHMRIPLVLHI